MDMMATTFDMARFLRRSDHSHSRAHQVRQAPDLEPVGPPLKYRSLISAWARSSGSKNACHGSPATAGSPSERKGLRPRERLAKSLRRPELTAPEVPHHRTIRCVGQRPVIAPHRSRRIVVAQANAAPDDLGVLCGPPEALGILRSWDG